MRWLTDGNVSLYGDDRDKVLVVASSLALTLGFAFELGKKVLPVPY